jgi:hypothetical protein
MPKGKKKTTTIREPPTRMLFEIEAYNRMCERETDLENQLARAQSDLTIERTGNEITVSQRTGFHDLAKQTQDQYDGYRRGVEETLRVIYGKPPIILERR